MFLFPYFINYKPYSDLKGGENLINKKLQTDYC